MKNLKSVKNILKSICLTTTHLDMKDLMKKQKFWMNKNGHFALDKQESENFYKIANYIRNDHVNGYLSNDVSKKDIENFLLEFISEVIILPNQTDKIKKIDSIEIDIKQRVESKLENHEIISPILNFNIRKKLKFGKMFFYPFTEYQLKKEMEFIINLLKRNSIMNGKQKSEVIKIWKSILSFYQNQSIVKCSFLGTSTAAELKFYNSALLHINSLKFLFYDIQNYKPSRKKSISNNKYMDTIVKTIDGAKTTNYRTLEFNFNLADISFLKTKKARIISAILKDKNKNEIDNRILGSINWAVSSIEKSPKITDESDFFNSSVYMTPNKYILSQCLLNILIAFESLLIFKNERSQKKELLKYRSIALLENTGFKDSFIIEQIGKAYELRSELVHEGKFINSPKSIFQLFVFFRDIVFELIELKVKEKITMNNQLKKWFLMKENLIRYKERKSEFNESKKSK